MVKISVVIPTRDRAELLAQTIISVAEQDLAPTEIIVVDNGSSDGTDAVVRGLAQNVHRLRYLCEPRPGVSRARNVGAGAASTELVAFIDDDAVASPGWLAALAVAAHDEPQTIAFAGPILLRWSAPAPRWVQGLEGWYGHFDLGPARVAIEMPRYPFGSNVALRREPFLSVGGFPVQLGPRGSVRIANEEEGLFRRVAARGWHVTYEPDARVYHWVHADRLAPSYLLRRAATQGRSDSLVEDLFARAAPSRLERARRSVRSTADAARTVRAGAARPGRDRVMQHSVEAATHLGRVAHDVREAMARRASARAVKPPQIIVGLAASEHERFALDGFVHVRGAFADAAAMTDRVWAFLARRGIDRDDRITWPTGDARHLQKLLRDPAFMAIGGDRTTAVIDDLLGRGRWARPNHWGEFLVTFPDRDRPWTVPTLWHTDADYADPLQPLRGLMVFSFLNRVQHRGGGTFVVAGSHRIVARFATARPGLRAERAAVTRRAFYRSHPWLESLVNDSEDGDRFARLAQEADIDGLPARVVELTGEPGDIVVAHPLLAHCIAPNGADRPRFMRIVRPRAL